MPFYSPLPKSEMNIACIRIKLQKPTGKYIHTKIYTISMCKKEKNM